MTLQLTDWFKSRVFQAAIDGSDPAGFYIRQS